MISDSDKRLVIKYMERNYQVTRVKINNRFKRAIVLENNTPFFLSDKNSVQHLKSVIHQNLSIIFYLEPKFLSKIVDEFLY
jgi:hypothetical protein